MRCYILEIVAHHCSETWISVTFEKLCGRPPWFRSRPGLVLCNTIHAKQYMPSNPCKWFEKNDVVKKMLANNKVSVVKKKCFEKSGLWRQNASMFAPTIPSNAVQNGVAQLDTVQDQTEWMPCFKNLLGFHQIAKPLVQHIIGPTLLSTRPRQCCENRAHASQMGLFSSFHDRGFHLPW